MKKIFKLLWLIIIFTVIFLRFYKLKELFFFMVDESTANLVAKRIIVDLRPVLLGPDIPGGLNTGPLFYYLTAIIMFFSKFNPLGEAIFASFMGFLSMMAVYLIGVKIFNSKKISLFSTIVYSFSSLIIIYNRTYSTLTFSSIATLLTYYALYRLTKNEYRWFYLLSFALILGTHSEGSSFSLILLCIFFFYNFFRKKVLKIRSFYKALIIFFLSFSPLVLFDIRHQFILLKRLMMFLSVSHSGNLNFITTIHNILLGLTIVPKTFSRIFYLTGRTDITFQILPCTQCSVERLQIPGVLIFVCSLAILYFLIKSLQKKSILGLKLISWHLLSMIIGVILYNIFFPGYFYEWLFVIFFPGFCYITGYCLSVFWKRFSIFVIILLLLFISHNLKTFFNLTNHYGLAIKEKAIKYAFSIIDSKNYSLNSIGECFNYGGYRYLFWHYGKEPVTSYADDLYVDWLYPKINNPKLDWEVIMVNFGVEQNINFYNQYNVLKNLSKYSRSFEEIEVLIIKNNTNYKSLK